MSVSAVTVKCVALLLSKLWRLVFVLATEISTRHCGKASVFHCRCPWGGRLVKFKLKRFVVHGPPFAESHVSCPQAQEGQPKRVCNLLCEVLVRPEVRPCRAVMCLYGLTLPPVLAGWCMKPWKRRQSAAKAELVSKLWCCCRCCCDAVSLPDIFAAMCIVPCYGWDPFFVGGA